MTKPWIEFDAEIRPGSVFHNRLTGSPFRARGLDLPFDCEIPYGAKVHVMVIPDGDEIEFGSSSVGVVVRVSRDLVHDSNTGEIRAFGSTVTLEMSDPCSVCVGQTVTLIPVPSKVEPLPCPKCVFG